MEGIKVGEYVRTDKGIIVKIDKEKKNLQMLKFLDVEYGNIIKHSPNIIDLIEEGDYVNGERIDEITEIDEEHPNRVVWHLTYYGDDDLAFENDDIKSIITKEQIESIKYEV